MSEILTFLGKFMDAYGQAAFWFIAFLIFTATVVGAGYFLIRAGSRFLGPVFRDWKAATENQIASGLTQERNLRLIRDLNESMQDSLLRLAEHEKHCALMREIREAAEKKAG